MGFTRKIKPLITQSVLMLSVFAAGVVSIIASRHDIRPPIDCSKIGTHSLFVATFNNDNIGSPPDTSTLFGPPGAELILQCPGNNALVINSSSLSSKALKITRSSSTCVIIARAGNGPHTSGIYYINYKAHSLITPQHLISGLATSIADVDNNREISTKLYDNAYYLKQGNTYTPLAGDYDPNAAHTVHIELNKNTNKYSMCIDNIPVANNRGFNSTTFGEFNELRFFMPAMVTDGFKTEYVLDEIRVHQ